MNSVVSNDVKIRNVVVTWWYMAVHGGTIDDILTFDILNLLLATCSLAVVMFYFQTKN